MNRVIQTTALVLASAVLVSTALHGCVVVSSTKTDVVDSDGRKASSSKLTMTHGAADAAPKGAAQGRAAPLTTSDVVGLWTITDERNDPFILTVGANGKAVTNWSKGNAGAAGERGTWTIVNGDLTVNYGDGWTDVLRRTGEGVEKRSFAPGANRTGTPSTWG
ncbi:MAG: hypothetical protein JNK53_00435, partial [Phycisphaerae bacterium]|nr:hypothetical protein [Phycisphaerae bacterium]